ncbi:uncharacterized protein [Pituophis catenifer annectens]|uniref:uncharacterized protein n=1 Tax=Pituophis catenifer annectens TaxID=94852 RepID=UPI0039949B08
MLDTKGKKRMGTYSAMRQDIPKCYLWAMPFLLISLILVLYAGVSNATQENAATSSNSSNHPTEFWMKTMTAEPWQPFLSQTPEKEKAKEGETVVFGCQYHSPQGSSLNNLTVKWYKRDGKGQKDVMENNVTALENNTRIFMAGNLSEGDASLTILKVSASDHGTYYCQVILSNGDVVTGDGTKLRIQRALGWLGIEESIGTIIGVVAAGIGGLIVLIVVLTPRLRKCLPCAKVTAHEA